MSNGQREPDERDRSATPAPADVVEAIGKASEAFECVERARGHLYSFHQLMGHADMQFGEAVQMLADAGLQEDASELDEVLVGRNVLDGRWTFQIVEEFDDLYYSVAGALLRRLVDEHLDGDRHAHERTMKEQRRSAGRAGHEMYPPARSPGGGKPSRTG